MRYSSPTHEGRLIKRYKRFFADVQFDGQTVVAHVPNSGSMKGVSSPDLPCRISHDPSPHRKLSYTLEQVRGSGGWVGVNTSIPNKLVRGLFEARALPHWSSLEHYEPEIKIGDDTRLDAVLWSGPRLDRSDLHRKKIPKGVQLHFVEIKNVSLVEDGTALFPDAVTTRGQKHLETLMKLMKEGFTCELVFTVQRTDADSFQAARQIDPRYSDLLEEAHEKGLRITPVVFEPSAKGIEFTGQILRYRPD